MEQFLVITHISLCFLLIVVVLLQQGKGAEVGATFGSGASQTLFGSRGSAPFLNKFTWLLIALLAATSLGLTITKTTIKRQKSVIKELNQPSLNIPQANDPKTE